jgi:hypothetical protein
LDGNLGHWVTGSLGAGRGQGASAVGRSRDKEDGVSVVYRAVTTRIRAGIPFRCGITSAVDRRMCGEGRSSRFKYVASVCDPTDLVAHRFNQSLV